MPTFEEFTPEDFSPQAGRERTQKKFKDFLIAREIAGTLDNVPHGGYIPAEFIVDEGANIEIIATPPEDVEHDHDIHAPVAEPTVLIHRTAENEVESIEFLCTCGQKVVVKLLYENL